MSWIERGKEYVALKWAAFTEGWEDLEEYCGVCWGCQRGDD